MIYNFNQWKIFEKENDSTDEFIDEQSEKNASKFNTSKDKLKKVLNEVFKRGVGAFRSNPESVRPNIKKLGPTAGAIAWGIARVKSFLKKGDGTYGGADKDLRENL